ncbi:MAG: LytTR family DNA-binding domain-containing protein [Saprospiraceae bacterium]
MPDYSKSNIGNLSVVGTTLAELETELPPQSFYRIHNSYLVNRNAIVSKSKDEVQLQGNDRLPLARNRREDFYKWYMKNPMKG